MWIDLFKYLFKQSTYDAFTWNICVKLFHLYTTIYKVGFLNAFCMSHAQTAPIKCHDMKMSDWFRVL